MLRFVEGQHCHRLLYICRHWKKQVCLHGCGLKNIERVPIHAQMLKHNHLHSCTKIIFGDHVLNDGHVVYWHAIHPYSFLDALEQLKNFEL